MSELKSKRPHPHRRSQVPPEIIQEFAEVSHVDDELSESKWSQEEDSSYTALAPDPQSPRSEGDLSEFDELEDPSLDNRARPPLELVNEDSSYVNSESKEVFEVEVEARYRSITDAPPPLSLERNRAKSTAEAFFNGLQREQSSAVSHSKEVSKEMITLEHIYSLASKAFRKKECKTVIEAALKSISKEVQDELVGTKLEQFIDKGWIEAFSTAVVSACNRAIHDLDFSNRFKDSVSGKGESLNSVFAEFLEIASKATELVISEMHQDLFNKIIPPVQIGGVAGGEKFISRSILLKIARDPIIREKQYLYGGAASRDDLAMKGSAHELKAASILFDLLKKRKFPIQLPLQTLIDYKGYRVVAMPVVPILGKETLVYGSCDAGKTVLNEDLMVDEVIREIAEELHLAKHLVSETEICLAGDVEVHKGTDNNYYLLDLARCFPPEAPMVLSSRFGDENPNPRAIFFRMIRPEALKFWQQEKGAELSSDALSFWGVQDAAKHNENVLLCSQFVLDTQVGRLVDHLVQNYGSVRANINIPAQMHNFGLNVRHLGVVAQRISEHENEEAKPVLCSLFAEEILFRVIKNLLRSGLRKHPVKTGEGLKQEVVETLTTNLSDLVLASSQNLAWAQHLKDTILESFGQPALELFDMFEHNSWSIDVSKTLLRVFERCGISVLADWRNLSGGMVRISKHEVVSFFSTTKRLAELDIESILEISDSADHHLEQKDLEFSFRLRKLAAKTVRDSLQKFPQNRSLQELQVKQSLLLMSPLQPVDILEFSEQKFQAYRRLIEHCDLSSCSQYWRNSEEIYLRYLGWYLFCIVKESLFSSSDYLPKQMMTVNYEIYKSQVLVGSIFEVLALLLHIRYQMKPDAFNARFDVDYASFAHVQEGRYVSRINLITLLWDEQTYLKKTAEISFQSQVQISNLLHASHLEDVDHDNDLICFNNMHRHVKKGLKVALTIFPKEFEEILHPINDEMTLNMYVIYKPFISDGVYSGRSLLWYQLSSSINQTFQMLLLSRETG
jgi:hypothetical protein